MESSCHATDEPCSSTVRMNRHSNDPELPLVWPSNNASRHGEKRLELAGVVDRVLLLQDLLSLSCQLHCEAASKWAWSCTKTPLCVGTFDYWWSYILSSSPLLLLQLQYLHHSSITKCQWSSSSVNSVRRKKLMKSGSCTFYTHNRGYKFRLRAGVPHICDGSGSHFANMLNLWEAYDNELESSIWRRHQSRATELESWESPLAYYVVGYNRYTDPAGTCSTWSSSVNDQQTTDGHM